MTLPKRTTWFLIADSAKARIIESSGPRGAWKLVREWAHDDARAPSRDLGRDRPSRGRTIGTGEPFAISGTSEHDKEAQRFLSARAQDISEACKNDLFDQLVIAAAPAALGFLKKKLHADVIAKLVGALDKDLTNETEKDLHDYFLDKLVHW